MAKKLKKRIIKKLALGGILTACTSYYLPVFHVKGDSMRPTLKEKDVALSERLPFLNERIKIDDLVIFTSPQDSDLNLVKRVVGLPGDHYTHSGIESVIPENYYFVMGHNRMVSYDSRNFGPVEISERIIAIYSSKRFKFMTASQIRHKPIEKDDFNFRSFSLIKKN